MDKERFSTLLKDPSEVTNPDIKALNEYRKKYPYFQSLYVVVAKALKDRQHPKTEAFIKKAAIYSANRSHLKEIIEGDFQFGQKPTSQTQESPAIPVINKDEPQKEQANQKPEVPEKPIEEKEKAVTKTEEKDRTGEVEKEKQVTPVKEPKAEQKEEKPKPAEIASPAAKQGQEAPDKKPQASKEEIKVEPKNRQATESMPTPVPKKFDNDLAEIEAAKRRIEALLSGTLEEVSSTPQASGKSKITQKKGKKKNQIELIEKFIQNEPQIDRQKLAESESSSGQVNLADKSIKQNEDFETETLARLMVKQGKLKRAEEIYKKLSLKFPEKSAYFASQIEKLK
ncbi:hypothetical protein [Roseivirga sp.]|uniref:hypothetical protein n=1 Tax=Roseivirga sp. TaxID=1964215 RepID=UPI003B52DED8